MARLAERLYCGAIFRASIVTLSLLGACSGGPRTSSITAGIRTSTISGSISNLSSFGLASAEEFRVYALNTEGRHNYAAIDSSGDFSIDVPSSSLYVLYVLQDSDADGSYENLIGTFDAIAGGALDLVPIYTSNFDIGTFALPLGGPGSLIDLASNPALGKDMDGDGVLDDVDDDINGNGLIDSDDLALLDRDGDNHPNPIDIDRDGDTINNPIDSNQFDSSGSPLPYEQDSDGDGFEDIYDVEPTSLYGSLHLYYVTGRITYVPPGEALTAVAITSKGRFIRSVVDEHGRFSIPLRERELFLLYFMNGNVISNGQSTIDFRGIVDSISGGIPNGIAIGSSNLNLGNLSLPSNPLNRALNLSFSLMAGRDSDGDGIKDSVDSDKDGNGIADLTEITKLNFDGDLLPNNIDSDDDNDGDLDGIDTDRDGDSLPDPIDTDGDGISDSDDIDYDNDGQLDGTNPTLVETPDLDVPIAGTGIVFPAAQIQPNSIRVSWGYARDNASPANLLEYRVVSAVGSATDIDTASEVAALDPLALPVGIAIVQDWIVNINQTDATGLDYPETYFFAVLVRDEAGNQTLYTPQSQNTLDTTAPTRGTAISFDPSGSDNITVRWGTATDNVSVPGALEYKLVYASATTAIDTVAEADAASNVPLDWTVAATDSNVTGLSELTTYAFAVLVRDEAGNMALYTPTTATTTDVTAPVVGAGPYFSNISDGSATVEWDVATDNTTAEASLQYKVVYSTTAGGTDIDDITEANTTSNITLNWTANVTSANAASLSQSTEYYFSVLVRDLSGNISLYAPQSFITVNSNAPDITGSISFPSKTDTTIDLAWNEASDDLTPVDSLEYKVVKGSSATAIDTIAEANAVVAGADLIADWTADIQTASASGLTSGLRYYFTVLVRDDVGNIAIYSTQSTTTTDIVAPSAGTGPTFSATTATQTTVSWTASSDNLSTAANLSYKLVRSSDPLLIDEASEANTTPSSSFVVVMNWTANTLTSPSTGLTDNTTYYYAVFVRDQALNISVYAPQSVTTLDGTAPVVDVPADNITYTGTTETQTTVQWGAAADVVTPAASLEYRLVRASTAAAIDSAAEINAVSGAGLIMDWTLGSLLVPTEFTATGLTHSTQYFFAVAVRDQAGLVSVYTPQSVTTATPPNTGPTPGTNIVFSGTSDTRTVLTWGAATDDLTPQASLQYKVVRHSLAASISTVTDAETNGTLVVDWTTNLLTRTVTGLTANTSYAFAVIVRDGSSEKNLYAPQTVTTLAPMKVLFATNASVAGVFTMASADSTCNTEGRSRFDNTKTYKAVVVNGTTRTISTDWTLAASTSYKDKNGVFIGTTTAGRIFTFPLTQAFDSTLASNVYAWTGLNTNWTTSTNLCSATGAWTSNKNNKSGQVGSPFSTSNTSINSSARKCSQTSRFYCAEQ